MPDAGAVKPFARLYLGGAHRSHVNLKWNSFTAEYWDSSWVFFADAGIGLRFTRHLQHPVLQSLSY